QLLASGVELAFELGEPRQVVRCLDRSARLRLALGFVEEADQQQFLAFDLHGMDLDADWGSAAGIARLRADDDRACALPARLSDRRPELVAQACARHGEQI